MDAVQRESTGPSVWVIESFHQSDLMLYVIGITPTVDRWPSLQQSGRRNAQVNPPALFEVTSLTQLRANGVVFDSAQRTKRPIQLTSDAYCKEFPTGKN